MNINDLLNKPPEELWSLSDSQLQALFAPFIPATRTSVLPKEKPEKLGAEHRAVLAALEANREAIAKLKAARK